MRALTISLAASLLMLVPAAASAQTGNAIQTNQGTTGFVDSGGIRLRSLNERGIKAGNFLIWPSLILEGRWNSNVFREDSTEEPDDAPVLRILPGIAVSNANPNKLAFQVGVGADVRFYLSEDDRVSEQQGVGITGDLRLDILPKGPVTITIRDQFRRELETRNFSTSETYNHNYNEAAAQIAIHPGGGALNIALGYGFLFDMYDDFPSADYYVHDFRFRTTWKFYPKTLALLEASIGLFDWQESAPDTTVDTGHGIRVDHMPFRVYLGLNGFITKKLAALLKIGYGNSLHDDGPTFNHVIAQAEVAFKFTSNILAAAGFTRDFSGTSFYSNYYAENKTYLRGQMRLARRVGIDLSVSYHLVDFAEFDPATPGIFVSHKERRDQVLGVHAKVDVDITRWIGLSVGYELRSVFTKFFVETTDLTTSAKEVDAGEYTQHQVYGSVNVRY